MTGPLRLLLTLLALFLVDWPANAAGDGCPDLGERTVSATRIEAEVARISDTRLMGLARYFGGSETFVLRGEKWSRIDPADRIDDACAFAVVGRFETLLVNSRSAPSGAIAISPDGAIDASAPAPARLVANENLDGAFAALRYQGVWWVLRPLVVAGDWVVELLGSTLRLGWGLAIIGLALVMRILLLPVSRFTAAAQEKVAIQEAQLRPVFADIRREKKGEEAHMALLAAHSDLGISTTYRIRPVLGALVQIPFLVAIFHLLGFMPQLEGQGFLWISDLSLPDAIASLPFTVPGFGGEVSLLPFVMAASVVVSGRLSIPQIATPAERKKRMRNAVLTAAAFLLLLYPFPAALLLYWTMTNVLQIAEGFVRGRIGK